MYKNEILALLKDIVAYQRDTWAYWDKDEDMKVGKRTMALAGMMKGYHPVPDRLQALIKKLEDPLTELT